MISAASFVRATLDVLVRDSGGRATPALRWLAPHVALGVAQAGLSEMLSVYARDADACVCAAATLERAATRQRAAFAGGDLLQVLRVRFRASKEAMRASDVALVQWCRAVRELQVLAAKARGAPCLTCGILFRSAEYLQRHECGESA
jgi:hypothetical protein